LLFYTKCDSQTGCPNGILNTPTPVDYCLESTAFLEACQTFLSAFLSPMNGEYVSNREHVLETKKARGTLAFLNQPQK
jgi:hypothetical protein